ncbi:alpha/beta hydrolase-fold protein [Nocardia stercoris]|uniref:Acyl-CoA:diacylglycerol acyltransferase n=1 Tax=Nocardia stercoris TaxID=2483361 RepID=A0A3M2KUR1_9NOCA|nr:alpha/beta hydrolase-fold protein [Nocardia stercoris]RMI28396.1 alpha/beta hydrolase [Nocardia stercoris]
MIDRRFSRRALLGGGLALAACAAPGRSAIAPTSSAQVATTAVTTTLRRTAYQPGQIVSGEFVSAARGGATCGWSLAYPPVQVNGPLRVAIALHGRWATHNDAFAGLGLDSALAQVVSAGTPPFAIAAVDGGDGYWHPRNSGEDAGAMVTAEFLPVLAGLGIDTSRIALLGWSMGGYGALWLASQLGPGVVASVAAESPALWHSFGESAAGAFDDADDFAAHTVFGREAALSGIPVRIDCGTSDPFYNATLDFVGGLSPAPAGEFPDGGHNADFWRSMAPAQLQFIGSHW